MQGFNLFTFLCCTFFLNSLFSRRFFTLARSGNLKTFPRAAQAPYPPSLKYHWKRAEDSKDGAAGAKTVCVPPIGPPLESSSDRPKRSKKAVVQRREELRCHGLKTNKYINKDRLQKIMEDEFCTDAFAQGEVDKEKCVITGRLDKDSGSIARTYLQGTVEEFDIALDFKPGYFPVMNVTECKGTFTYQLIDGCDEKNGENPLDWKAGGVYNSGTVAYRIDPKIERRPAPKVPTAGCQKFKGIIWGRGFGGGDWGKLLLNWLEECNGHHRINLYPQFKYFFDRGEREWELRVKKNKQTAGCVGHAIKMAGGPANAGCDFWQGGW